MKIRYFFVLAILLTVFIVAFLPSTKKSEYCSNKDKVAINGFDVVAYFKENKAVEGSSKFSFEFAKSKWYFKNQENLDSFKNNPKLYLPQFGGYCTIGLSRGNKMETDPKAFKIINGKLYLIHNLKKINEWLKDSAATIIKAEAEWEKMQKN